MRHWASSHAETRQRPPVTSCRARATRPLPGPWLSLPPLPTGSRRTSDACCMPCTVWVSFCSGHAAGQALDPTCQLCCRTYNCSPWTIDIMYGAPSPGDMEKTIEYYKKCFGMKLLRFRDIPEARPPPPPWPSCLPPRATRGRRRSAVLSPTDTKLPALVAGEVLQRLPGLRPRGQELCAGAGGARGQARGTGPGDRPGGAEQGSGGCSGRGLPAGPGQQPPRQPDPPVAPLLCSQPQTYNYGVDSYDLGEGCAAGAARCRLPPAGCCYPVGACCVPPAVLVTTPLILQCPQLWPLCAGCGRCLQDGGGGQGGG